MAAEYLRFTTLANIKKEIKSLDSYWTEKKFTEVLSKVKERNPKAPKYRIQRAFRRILFGIYFNLSNHII